MRRQRHVIFKDWWPVEMTDGKLLTSVVFYSSGKSDDS